MSNHFNKVTIENFKSIKKIDFECKRINLFLGEPNVGKSNILEALALFSSPFSIATAALTRLNNTYSFARHQIRYKNIRNLFFFQDTTNSISVTTNKGIARMQLTEPQHELYEFIITGNETQINEFDQHSEQYSVRNGSQIFESLSLKDHLPNFYLHLRKDGSFNIQDIPNNMNSYQGFVKKYVFNETLFQEENEHNKYPFFLMPSYGSNVFTIVNGDDKLADLVSGFFEKYDLELIFISEKNEYVIQRKQGRIATQLPYDSIADTLQRIIFHLAAIYSNKDSVLIFEEPESHSFPDYIQLLATKI
ncbi:MAG: AAA family ATPase, partial [Bacteroidota bacterium]